MRRLETACPEVEYSEPCTAVKFVMSIRNVFYEITSFHALMVAEQNSAKGKRENHERMFFYEDLEGNLLMLPNY